MKIQLTSVMVVDQEKALQFYTGVLGFVKKYDIPMGDFRWLRSLRRRVPTRSNYSSSQLIFLPLKSIRPHCSRRGSR